MILITSTTIIVSEHVLVVVVGTGMRIQSKGGGSSERICNWQVVLDCVMGIKAKNIILTCISGIPINIAVVIIVRVVVIAMVVNCITAIIGVVIKIGLVIKIVEDAGTNSYWKIIPLLGLSTVGGGSCI